MLGSTKFEHMLNCKATVVLPGIYIAKNACDICM